MPYKDCIIIICLHCFETVGWASGRTSGLLKLTDEALQQGGNDLNTANASPSSHVIKIQIVLKPAYTGCPGKAVVKWASVFFRLIGKWST